MKIDRKTELVITGITISLDMQEAKQVRGALKEWLEERNTGSTERMITIAKLVNMFPKD